METKKQGTEQGHRCVGCGTETQEFFSASLGWYCGNCKRMWKKEAKNE